MAPLFGSDAVASPDFRRDALCRQILRLRWADYRDCKPTARCRSIIPQLEQAPRVAAPDLHPVVLADRAGIEPIAATMMLRMRAI
jgi:hypothetical protein